MCCDAVPLLQLLGDCLMWITFSLAFYYISPEGAALIVDLAAAVVQDILAAHPARVHVPFDTRRTWTTWHISAGSEMLGQPFRLRVVGESERICGFPA